MDDMANQMGLFEIPKIAKAAVKKMEQKAVSEPAVKPQKQTKVKQRAKSVKAAPIRLSGLVRKEMCA